MAKKQTVEVKLVGGPMDGRLVTIPKGADEYRVGGFWTYEFAGREAHRQLFAVRPTSRRERKFIRWYVRKVGRDPRIEQAAARGKTVRKKAA